MDGVYKHYVIDLSCNNNFVQVPAVQGDGNNVRGFEVELISNNVQYVVDAEKVIVSIAGTKPDTKEVLNECEVTEEGFILVDITSQMTAVAGRGDYSITLMDRETNALLQSFPFYILITKSAFNANNIVSSNEFQLLTHTVTDAKNTIDDMRELEAEVTANEEIRKQSELEREQAEHSRRDAETLREQAEIAREQAEQKRQADTATAIQNAEKATNDAITATQNADDATAKANQATNDALDATQDAIDATKDANDATARVNALETSFTNAENIRKQNEDVRKQAEVLREQAEQLRRDAEVLREQAEQKRQADTATAIQDTQQATNDALDAIANAEDATSDAITATQNANTATDNANTATTNAINATDGILSMEQSFTDAEAIRVQNEDTRIANEIQRQKDSQEAIDGLGTAIQDTKDATDRANTISSTLEQKLANGEFNGKDGVIMKMEADEYYFTIVDGDLILTYEDGVNNTN